MRINKNKVI